MESESPNVLVVSYNSETVTGYAFSTEAPPAAAPSTTFRTISVKKFATASMSSSVQITETFFVEAVAVTSFENTPASTTPTTSSTSATSSISTSIQSSGSTSTPAALTTTSTTSTQNPEPTTSILSSRISSASNERTIQTTSLTPSPTIIPTSTETLLALPTTSAPRFTHSPEPTPSQEQPSSQRPLTITFTTLGSVSLVLLLITFFFRHRKRKLNSQHLPPKTMRESRRRTVYELITSANVREKDGESVDLFKKGSLKRGLGSLRGESLRGFKGSFRRGRERIYELECENEEREEVNWMNLKNRVRERTVERLGGTLGVEGRRGVRDGDGGTRTGKTVRWAVG